MVSAAPRSEHPGGPAARVHLPVLSGERARLAPTPADRIEPPVRGERWLAYGDALLQRLVRQSQRLVPPELDPLSHTGAIANTTFLIACVSGILLLFWYSPSVHQAYESVRAMQDAPWSAGLVRSVHRYSSDACMLFVLLHATQLFFARRFGGARWLAWVTGALLIGTLWLVGWLGYWLVWDERARQVALGTVRMLDVVPIFADPPSRSFLADETVGSLLFFVVFFLHMLIPLAMGIALWLHITRLSRPRFLTRRWMTLWVVGATLLVSLLAPADLAEPARMAEQPTRFAMDYWYLLPVAFTDRLGGASLWALVLVGGAVLFSLPWTLVGARARVARVNDKSCNGCQRCYADCPYDAIRMVSRRDRPPLARIDPLKCLGCGICAGSCDAAAIGLDWFDSKEQRRRIDRALRARPGDVQPIAFVCARAAAGALRVDQEAMRSPDLDGYSVVRVPCIGWLHPLDVERALRGGATGALLVSCNGGVCPYREGPKWIADRLGGRREPSLRSDKVDASRIHLVELLAGDQKRLVGEARRFRDSVRSAPAPRRTPGKKLLGASIATGTLAVAVWGATRIVYAAPAAPQPELIVSFKHAGSAGERCRDLTEAERQARPVHMRPKKLCERKRPNVRMEVIVDGQTVHAGSYEPRGIWQDGSSIAIERLKLTAGRHDVEVRIGDSGDGTFQYTTTRTLELRPHTQTTVLFDKAHGFHFYPQSLGPSAR